MEEMTRIDIHQCKDFRVYLGMELINRCKKNQSYSLRSFAKSLNLSHAALSQILNKKRPLTQKMTTRLSIELGLDPQRFFVKKNISLTSEGTDTRDNIAMDMDEFEYISKWYYFAILELIKINSCDNRKWFARVLSLSITEINIALDRLCRMNLIKIESSVIIDLSGGYTNSLHHSVTNSAKKSYQKELLEKSIASIDEDLLDERSHSGVTMAISTKKIESAKMMINKFRRELMDYLEDEVEGEVDEVYHLNIGLFPLTKVKKINKKIKIQEKKNEKTFIIITNHSITKHNGRP